MPLSLADQAHLFVRPHTGHLPAARTGFWARLDALRCRAVTAAILAEAAPRPGERVLAVGSPTPALLGAAADAGAAARAATAAEACALGPAAHAHDCVVLRDVLDVAPDPAAALVQACRLVAPGGRLLVTLRPRHLGGQLFRLERWLRGQRVRLLAPSWCARVGRGAGLWTRAVREPSPCCTLVVLGPAAA